VTQLNRGRSGRDLGSGAMTNSLEEVLQAKVIFVIGSNTTWNHPVFASLLKQAVKLRGAKLIVCDPRRIDLVDFADIWLQQRNGSDVALLSGLVHIIVREGWKPPTTSGSAPKVGRNTASPSSSTRQRR